jgi:hypothetical protein
MAGGERWISSAGSLGRLLQDSPLLQRLFAEGLGLLQHLARERGMRNVFPAHPPVQATRLLFALGRAVATPNALRVLEAHGVRPATLLRRHVRGDWGELSGADAAANREALEHGGRIFSSYRIGEDLTVWVVTEADRSVTTVTLPEDY